MIRHDITSLRDKKTIGRVAEIISFVNEIIRKVSGIVSFVNEIIRKGARQKNNVFSVPKE